MLLSTHNLKMKGNPGKLQRRFVGPFRVIETIGQQAYKLALPEDWKIHPVFHLSLLKDWRTTDLKEDHPVTQNDVPEVEEPYYEIESILRWRTRKRNKKIIKEYLVLWKGFPMEESTWITSEQFVQPKLLQQFIQDDKPVEEKL